MGTINHNAIIATTCIEESYQRVMQWVDEQPEFEKSLVVFSTPSVNGYRTICVSPDGSKERWEISKLGNVFRQSFIDRLAHEEYSDGSSPWSWVEVSFGEYGQSIVRGNNRDEYSEYTQKMKRYSFKNGMSVHDLKALLADWPERHSDGTPCEVWIGNGFSSPVKTADLFLGFDD